MHLACVPKSGGRIGELALVATGRDYHTARKLHRAEEWRSTKRLLRVFAAASTEVVRLIVVPKDR